ncbi:MAG: type VI secretion system tip protein VgrG [Cytophagaceae bacterium]|jgi:Rhs element Vgr protein|nr:type VI secretion system tip protein VgrG [Cytophagaceae bacterium]
MPELKHEGFKLKVEVKVDGTALQDSIEIISISTAILANKIPSASIVFSFGGLNEEDYSFEAKKFAPGKKVEIKVGYDSKTEKIFTGIITKVAHKFSSQFQLVLHLRGECIKLSTQRKYGVFQKKKDSDIISEIIQKAGLTVSCDATSVMHEEMVQYGCSDWDFILMRAENCGMLLIEQDGKIKVAKPNFSEGAALTLAGFNGVYSMDLEVDSTFQFKNVETLSWIPKDQKSLSSKVSSSEEMKMEATFSNSNLSSVLNTKPYAVYTPLNIAKDGLDNISKGKLMRVALDKVKGEIEIIGTSAISCGDILEIKNMQDFSGKVYVTGVTHLVEDAEWKTILTIGMPFGSYAEETPMISVPAAAGTLAPIKGLASGVVKKIHEDKDGQYRVEVALPMLGSTLENLHVHARLSNLYASNGFGSFFYPEIGDEVILGFLHEDPSQPVILGMLYSSKNKPFFTPDDKNQFKGIVTKSKITIKIDDEDKILTIETPAKNSVVLDDKEGQIVITDKNKNTITMSKDGITISSEKDIIMKAKGNIQMEAKSNIEMKATADLKGEGMNVNLEGKTGLVAKGSASAELSASGQTTVKGAIVMIN